MNSKSINAVFAASAIAVAGLAATASNAATIAFEQITNNTGLDASSQMVVEVTDGSNAGDSGAIFNFSAVTGALSSFTMAELYWSDLSGIFVPPPVELSSSAGVNMTEGTANPGNLPSGNTASPAFVATSMLVADAAPGNANGIDIGEFYEVFIKYDTGYTFADVLADLGDGDLRLGIHVRSHNGGGSESYVGGGPCDPITQICSPGVTEVPLPAGLPLLFAALGSVGILARRKKSS